MSDAFLCAWQELSRQLKGEVFKDEPMARHTSYRLGGPAALYVECATLRDLSATFAVLGAYQLPWAILGKGSNILVADQGWRGAVLTLTEEFKRLRLPDEQTVGGRGEGARDATGWIGDFGNGGREKGRRHVGNHRDGARGIVPPPSSSQPFGGRYTHGQQSTADTQVPGGLLVAGAGVLLSTLVQAAFKGGIRGFEFAVGIPGTLGGALAMNAGTAKEWIGSVVRSLTVYRSGSGLARIEGDELPWNYRQSGLPAADIILEAELWATSGHTGQIRAKMEAALNRRKRSQPLTKPSAGSIFKNPPDQSAGALIDALGLKGFTIGGAEVSPLHANFIVTNGSATAADVLAIILMIKQRVKEAYGIELQNEIRFLGFEG
ncbi:MAG: UDP-N-acetylmuramate dehydrogenase [Coriobacteriales bacterium]|jgi:UDP-N-acetylenolpyruvoylglucosamine reductase|nr:UDP-N-acetylmuramate dehydrogenase [Coriobacteriales bacterium]